MTFKINDIDKTIVLLDNVNVKVLEDTLKKVLGDAWEEYTIVIEQPAYSFIMGVPNKGDFNSNYPIAPLGTFVGTCEATAKL